MSRAQALIDAGWTNGTRTFASGTPLAGTPTTRAGKVIHAAWTNPDRTTTDESPDTTPPALSSPSGAATGTTTADLSVTTDEANGTLYAVVTTSSTSPSKAQLKAGQDHAGAAATYDDSQAISSTGAKGFSASGLSASTTYYAHFMHEDAAGNQSDVASSAGFATDTPDTTPPTAPAGLSATASAGSDPGLITLDWDDNAEPDFAAYNVYRATDVAGPYTLIQEGWPVSTLEDEGLSNGTTYFYKITAVDDSDNESAFSAVVSATPLSLAAPTDLAAVASGETAIDLSWSHGGGAQYAIERSRNGVSGWAEVAVDAGSPYQDTGLTPGTTYHYRVRAYDGSAVPGDEYSPYSGTASATTEGTAPVNSGGKAHRLGLRVGIGL